MSAEDRRLTDNEWAQVEKQIDEVQKRMVLKELGQMLIDQKTLIAAQAKRIREQGILIKILEDLNTSRNDKLVGLERTLELLETEIARLR